MRTVIAVNKNAQVFLYVVGAGATGKSIFGHILAALIGFDRVVHTTLKSLNSDNFETYNLAGKPLIMISDSEEYVGDLAILKQIVGNDAIKGRAKYVQGAFNITNTGNIMIIANIPFTARETSNAISRRLLVFPANNISKERKPLIEHWSGAFRGPLANELSGILK